MRRSLFILGVVGLVGGLTGCTIQQRPSVRLVEQHAGSTWHAVYPSPDVTALVRPQDPAERAEFYRNDGAMSIRSSAVALAGDEWRAPRRATIERTRRINIPDRSNTYLFFVPRRR